MAVDDWYRLDPAVAVRSLGSDPARGLTDAEARRRLATHGPNELVERERRTAALILGSQVKSLTVVVLLGAIAISLLTGDVGDALVILAIVVLNTFLGFGQEYRAERAMA